jgi:hypothetical protein
MNDEDWQSQENCKPIAEITYEFVQECLVDVVLENGGVPCPETIEEMGDPDEEDDGSD